MDYQWLRTQFELNPAKSKADLARALGLKPSAISKILKDTRQIKANEYHGMRNFFGLPVDGERSLQPHPSSLRPNAGLNESDTIADADWANPDYSQTAPFSIPKRVKAYEVKKDTGSVRFCLGETLLLDPDYTMSGTAEPFVISIGSEEILALCHIDDEDIVHVQPFGGRKLTTQHPKTDIQILGHIFSKMEII